MMWDVAAVSRANIKGGNQEKKKKETAHYTYKRGAVSD